MTFICFCEDFGTRSGFNVGSSKKGKLAIGIYGVGECRCLLLSVHEFFIIPFVLSIIYVKRCECLVRSWKEDFI